MAVPDGDLKLDASELFRKLERPLWEPPEHARDALMVVVRHNALLGMRDGTRIGTVVVRAWLEKHGITVARETLHAWLGMQERLVLQKDPT